ncbi:MAG TPA: ABC transporter permease [Nocardioidaceae bacterium]|nr:ABC transporter permease [Nocardioidaceae bacterium]
MPSDAGSIAAARRSVLRSVAGSWDFVLLVILAAVLFGAIGWIDNFAETITVTFLLLDVIPIALMATALTLVIVTGEIDLSVASILGLTSAVLGQLWLSGFPLEIAIALCVLLGAVLGAVNGLFVAGLGLPSLAVTIGTLALYRGLAYVVLGDRAVADFPFEWTTRAISTIGDTGIPVAVLPVIGLALLFGVTLHATPIGRALYAIGNNADTARFSGISVSWTKFWTFVASGVMSSLAGIFWTFRYASARADNGLGLELAVVAAVLLGGVSIFGGRGNLIGVLAAVVLLATLQRTLQLASATDEVLNLVIGSLLILSVVVPNVVQMLRQRIRPTVLEGPTP